ncbi:MAG: dihydrodipicolinate synthase family protein, partial [Variovorax paradoxus]
MAERPSLTGVFPVLPTPFDAQGRPDAASLRRLVEYLLRCGVDGMTYPGVASEVGQLAPDERQSLLDVVLAEVAGRVPVIAGVSSGETATTVRLAAEASARGAAALMVAVPPDRKGAAGQIAYFTEVARAAEGTALMLQNVPPPVGAGLDPEVVLEVLAAVPSIRYVKE